MGTNYYAVVEACSCCGRGEELHIGKSSAGWTFSFHATESIRSWKEWLVFLSKPNVIIRDEYGEVHTLESFIAWVKEKSTSKHNHAKSVLEQDTSMNGGRRFSEHYQETQFLDEEGNSFSTGEFS